MRAPKLLMAGLLLAASALLAQEIPAGTVIPVMLQTTLDAGKSKVGQKIEARVMQDVPLPGQARIRAGSKLIGTRGRSNAVESGFGVAHRDFIRSLADGRRRRPGNYQPALAGFHDGRLRSATAHQRD